MSSDRRVGYIILAVLGVVVDYDYIFASRPDGFTYWASPTVPDSTGTRRFCVDQRGVVLQYRLDDGWTVPAPPTGPCPPSGVPIDPPGR